MPTEDDARQLLARAAATIDVDESAPMTLTGLPEPRHRRWPVLAAAAAAVLAIAGGLLVAQQLGDEPQPAPTAGPAGADREPVEQEHVYEDDELPSLLGYTEDEARDLLVARGLRARTVVSAGCAPPGLVMSTSPGPGSPLRAGGTVDLRIPSLAVRGGDITQPSCDQVQVERVGELLRFARGLGPAPDLSGGISIAVGEGEYVDLSAEEAADPRSWVLCDDGECHSALAALEQIVTTPVEMDGFFARTFLEVTDTLMPSFNGPHPVCVTPDPLTGLDVLKHHPTTYVRVDHPKDGAGFCPPPPILQIEWTDDHRIAAVRLRLALESETVDTEELELSLDRASAAERFTSWARGDGPAPDFADRVRVMFFGGPASGHPGWTDEPESRSSYAGCSGLGFPDCGLDPVALLHRYRGPVVPSPGRSTCADGGEVPQRFAEAEGDVVRLEEPEPASCQAAWAVELWIDESGEIYGVNQAGMEPQSGG